MITRDTDTEAEMIKLKAPNDHHFSGRGSKEGREEGKEEKQRVLLNSTYIFSL